MQFVVALHIHEASKNKHRKMSGGYDVFTLSVN